MKCSAASFFWTSKPNFSLQLSSEIELTIPRTVAQRVRGLHRKACCSALHKLKYLFSPLFFFELLYLFLFKNGKWFKQYTFQFQRNLFDTIYLVMLTSQLNSLLIQNRILIGIFTDDKMKCEFLTAQFSFFIAVKYFHSVDIQRVEKRPLSDWNF